MNLTRQQKYKLKMKKLGEWGKHKGNRTEQSKRYRLKNPEKIKAYRIMERLRKKMNKSSKCYFCNKNSNRIIGHHYDYKKPDKVIWMCIHCHNKLHNIL